MGNSRVMVFDASTSTLTSTSTGEFAEAVIGQSSYTSSGFNSTQNTMFIPQGNPDYDAATGRLFVSDTGNSRILVFDASVATLSSTPMGEPAEAVLGQQSSSGGTGGTNQYQMELPEGASFDPVSNQLFVSDTENNRIMVFDAADSTLTNTPLGENAEDELGQYSSVSDINNPSYILSNPNNGLYAATAQGLYAPTDVLVDTYDHRLFVSDFNNNRVLIYPLDANNRLITSSAEYVLGQNSLTASSSATSQGGLSSPIGLAFDHANERLFVADTLNNRVLVYDVSPGALIANPAGENAEAVLGQTSFSTSTSLSLGQNSLNLVQGVVYDSNTNRLFVADSLNNRVLVFDASVSALTNTPAGENAEDILGQASFSTNTATSTQSGFRIPQGMAFDGSNNRLFVADGFNNRVLVFDVSTTTLSNTPMGENAENVLGQSDYTSHSPAVNNTSLNTVQVGFVGLSYSNQAQKLFVADEINNRVVSFNVAPASIQNGEVEANVLGQVSYTSRNAATSQGGLNQPNGVFYDDTQNQLFVADRSNNRVTAYEFIKLTTPTLPNGSQNVSYSQTLTTQNAHSVTSFTISSGSLPPGLSLDGSAGVISGTPTTAGTFNFTVEADDIFNTGYYAATQGYTVTITGQSISGGGLPAVAYSAPSAPSGGLKIIIDNNAAKVTNPMLLVSSNGGSDIKYIALSTDSGFTNAGLIPYNSTVEWNLCGAPTCGAGNYAVYAKFYTSWGQQSPVVTVNINFQPISSPVAKNNSVPQTVVGELAASGNPFKTNLHISSRGAEVTALQNLLAKNQELYPEGLVTGLFGKLTQAAVEKFQIKYKIAFSGDAGYGLVGPKTRGQLNQLAGQTP